MYSFTVLEPRIWKSVYWIKLKAFEYDPGAGSHCRWQGAALILPFLASGSLFDSWASARVTITYCYCHHVSNTTRPFCL